MPFDVCPYFLNLSELQYMHLDRKNNDLPASPRFVQFRMPSRIILFIIHIKKPLGIRFFVSPLGDFYRDLP